MQVFGCQIDCAWEDKAASHARAAALLEQAAPPAGSLLVLGEMFSTGFSMNVKAVAEERGGPTHSFLAEQAKKFQSHVLGGVVTQQPDGRGRNEAVIYAPDGREAARYHKLHPFSYGGETAHYAPGSEIVVVEIGGWKVAPLICYDLRFPEAFRQATRRGAELLVVIACWPEPRDAHWQALLLARAIENQAYLVGVNRVGRDPKLNYVGHSRIIDPRGQILAAAGEREEVISAQLDHTALEEYRQQFPALSDIRAELLG